jgi:hypothetical protein
MSGCSATSAVAIMLSLTIWKSEGPLILEVIGWMSTLILCAAPQ